MKTSTIIIDMDIINRYPNKDNKTLQFIFKAERKFGKSLFDFSKVVYINKSSLVTIICKLHNNEFNITPENFFRSKFGGCKYCANESNSKKHTKWSKDDIITTAKKYNSLKKFRISEPKAYDVSVRNKWICEFTWLSRVNINNNERNYCIYVYEFIDLNYAYIGLTNNKIRRHSDHTHERIIHRGTDQEQKICSAVYEFCNNNNIDPKTIGYPKYIYENLTAIEASKLETSTLNYYKLSGWNIINKAKTGNLGYGSEKRTKEDILKILKESNNPNESSSVRSAYIIARKNGWLTESVKRDLWPTLRKNLSKITKEDILNIAKKLGNKFFKNNNYLQVSRKLNCLPEIYKILGYPRQNNIILIFNKDYTKILGKYWNINEGLKNYNLSYNNTANEISKSLDKKLYKNQIGILKDYLFSDFLKTIDNLNIKKELISNYNEINNKFDENIRLECKKYKNIII